MKKCTKCHTEKPLDEFYDKWSGQEYKDSFCIECRKEATNAYKKRMKESGANPILTFISERLDIPVKDIVSRKRKREYTHARIIASVLMKRGGMALRKIAEVLGKSDHTAITYYLKKHNDFLDSNDPLYLSDYNKVIGSATQTQKLANALNPKITELNIQLADIRKRRDAYRNLKNMLMQDPLHQMHN